MSKINNTSELEVEACGEMMTIHSNEVEVDVIDLRVVKTVCPLTFAGGTIQFCTEITNPSDYPISPAVFRDVLDPRLTYIQGTFLVNGEPRTPTVTNNKLEYVIPVIEPHSTVLICFKVRVQQDTGDGTDPDDETDPDEIDPDDGTDE